MDREGSGPARCRGILGGGIDAAEGCDDLGGVVASDVGQDYRAVRAVEERDAQLVLEQAHLMAYRGGRDGKLISRERKRAEPSRGLKCLNRLNRCAHRTARFG